MNLIYQATIILVIFTLLGDTTSLAQKSVSSTPCQTRAYVIDNDSQKLNVRSDANSRSAIIGKLPINTEVEVFASQENWMLIFPLIPNVERIKFHGKGWVYAPLLGTSTRGYERDRVAVFARANYQSTVVGQIPSDRQVNLLSCKGKWVLVEKQGIKGWLSPEDQCAAALTSCS